MADVEMKATDDGLVVVTKREFARGDWIMTERPVFQVRTVNFEQRVDTEEGRRMQRRIERAMGPLIDGRQRQTKGFVDALLRGMDGLDEAYRGGVWLLTKGGFREGVSEEEGALRWTPPEARPCLDHLLDRVRRREAVPNADGTPPRTEGGHPLRQTPQTTLQAELQQMAEAHAERLAALQVLGQHPPLEVMACLYECVMANGMHLRTPFGTAVGLQLYNICSDVAHSCRPNTAIVQTHEGCTVVALEDIAQGETLTANRAFATYFVDREDLRQEDLVMQHPDPLGPCDCGRCFETNRIGFLSDEQVRARARNGAKNALRVEGAVFEAAFMQSVGRPHEAAGKLLPLLSDSSLRSTLRDLITPAVRALMYDTLVAACVTALLEVNAAPPEADLQKIYGYIDHLIDAGNQLAEAAPDLAFRAHTTGHAARASLAVHEMIQALRRLARAKALEADVVDAIVAGETRVFKELEALRACTSGLGTVELANFFCMTQGVWVCLAVAIPSVIQWPEELQVE